MSIGHQEADHSTLMIQHLSKITLSFIRVDRSAELSIVLNNNPTSKVLMLSIGHSRRICLHIFSSSVDLTFESYDLRIVRFRFSKGCVHWSFTGQEVMKLRLLDDVIIFLPYLLLRNDWNDSLSNTVCTDGCRDSVVRE